MDGKRLTVLGIAAAIMLLGATAFAGPFYGPGGGGYHGPGPCTLDNVNYARLEGLNPEKRAEVSELITAHREKIGTLNSKMLRIRNTLNRIAADPKVSDKEKTKLRNEAQATMDNIVREKNRFRTEMADVQGTIINNTHRGYSSSGRRGHYRGCW